MSNTAYFKDLGLTPLRPEPWGKRLTRAREDAGYTVRSASERLGGFVSHATVSRLEQYDETPTTRKHRTLAVTLLILYGVDPSDFELGPDDAPTIIDLQALRPQHAKRSGERLTTPQVAGRKQRRLAATAGSDVDGPASGWTRGHRGPHVGEYDCAA